MPIDIKGKLELQRTWADGADGSEAAQKTNNMRTLQEELTEALPHGFRCSTRYIRTPNQRCDPLFSALPGQRPEKTRLSSHFLTVSVDPASVPGHVDAKAGGSPPDVMSFAIECLVYTTARLTTIFVSKIDSTSYLPRVRPSPVQRTATTFLRWLTSNQLERHPRRKVVISLFARAQAQYLFPGSSDERGSQLNKHVLDDRQLIKWWARVIDPIIPNTLQVGPESPQYQGYITVPGYEGNELRRCFVPPSRAGEPVNPHWQPGNPLLELAHERGLPEHAPPRCLLPRFPDDPKARFVMDLDEELGISQETVVTASPSKHKSGRWSSVRDLNSFWEAMEFRQECSSGRVVGFLWLVITPAQSDNRAELAGVSEFDPTPALSDSRPSLRSRDTQKSGRKVAKHSKAKRLTGPIIPRAPRLKGSHRPGAGQSLTSSDPATRSSGDGVLMPKDGYDKVMQTLLNLDFANIRIAIRSTQKWVSEVRSICGLAKDFSVTFEGAAAVPVVASARRATDAINDLGGMVRRKRKATTSGPPDGSVASAGEMDTPSSNQPAVNVLAGTNIRKKPKPTVA